MPKKHQPSVSILVPCYNVEAYLRECLDSIVNQTLTDIEIICINDGSTDGTLGIIKEYAAKDKRIKIIDKENEGYGKSMNRGLDAATGEYVGIVESDDWAEPDMFESLYTIAKENDCDVVKSNFYEYTPTGAVVNKFLGALPPDDCGRLIVGRANPTLFFHFPAIWSAIYRRDFLVRNNIRFLESPGASYQDTGFNFKVWAMARRSYLTDKAYLHYRCDNANSSVKSTGKIFCVCDEYDSVCDYLMAHNMMDDGMRKLLAYGRYTTYVWNLHRLGGDAYNQFLKRFSDEFRGILKSGDLSRNSFDDRAWMKLQIIAHPHNPWYRLVRAFYSVIQPVYKTRIRDNKKVYFVFNNIRVYSRPVPTFGAGASRA